MNKYQFEIYLFNFNLYMQFLWILLLCTLCWRLVLVTVCVIVTFYVNASTDVKTEEGLRVGV